MLRSPVEIRAHWVPIARDHALHRLRAARGLPHGVLHPIDVVVGPEQLAVHFAPGELDAHEDRDLEFGHWRDRVLLPCLHALADCLTGGTCGFAPFAPVRGRWVPPPSWFLPALPGVLDEDAVRADLALAADWLASERARCEPPRHPADRRLVESLLGALRSRDLAGLNRLLRADVDELRRRARLAPMAPSFLALLTEAELLERALSLFPFRVVSERRAVDLGLRSRGGERVLELDPTWKDPHFPTLTRPSPQEIWDALVDESRTTPWFVVSERLMDPLRKAPSEAPRVRWVGVHVDQPYVSVRLEGTSLPDRGFVLLTNTGDDTLMKRKRTFTTFAGEHPALERLLACPPEASPFRDNPQPRANLEEAVLGVRGVFPVQGPPGTGKTHLATQVVRRFLAREPGARVLVCAKEHFALDHILRKITTALLEDELPCRAWRSVSQARLRKGRGEIDARWLAPQVTRELAELRWAPEAEGWSLWQAASADEHDRRLATLGEQAANLFFCTTMDGAMVDFAGSGTAFDLVVVEEAGKCYPSEILHALCLGRTILMIGDHMQLPPYQEKRTREGAEAWRRALGRALDDRDDRDAMQARFGSVFKELLALAESRGPLSTEELAWLRPFEFLFDRVESRHRLEEQFRMEAPLSRVVGSVFYGRPFDHRKGELVERGLLSPRPLGDVLPPELDVPLVWLDTPHMLDVPEATEDDEKRGVRDNRFELRVVLAYLRRLRPGHPVDMVILTPYNAQKSLLLASEELRAVCEKLTDIPFDQVVRTTDEYQGREAELTVLSLVRNNSLGARAWGFMTELERLNVMFSRTRFRQVVVGCSAHIERHANEAPWLHAVWRAYQAEAGDPACARIVGADSVLDG